MCVLIVPVIKTLAYWSVYFHIPFCNHQNTSHSKTKFLSSTMAASPHTALPLPLTRRRGHRRWTLERGNKADMAGCTTHEGTHRQPKIFHWRDVCYGQPKRLLDQVDDWARAGPGTLTASIVHSLLSGNGAWVLICALADKANQERISQPLLDTLANHVMIGVKDSIQHPQREDSFQRVCWTARSPPWNLQHSLTPHPQGPTSSTLQEA